MSADTNQLKTQLHEQLKQHVEFDGSARPEYVYTARTDAADGTPCSVVRYAYVGATSKVEFMKEYIGAWDSDWDLF